jgi:tetratricopeptide (TPR) repeat protein
LARNHPQTLLSALGRGGDLRGLGLFAEALLEDQATWEGLREAFGEDHPQAHMAAHNLASAMFLSGDVAGALRLAEHNYHQRLRLLGENDVSTWSPLIQMGVYRRELGDYQAASRALRTAAQRLSALRRELNTVGASVQWHQAIVLRCEGSAAAAKGRNGEALRAFRELLGPDHPNTLACRLSYAAAARAVGGEQVAGVELVKTVLHDYLSTVGLVADHPFVALSRLSLGLAQCAAGLDGLQETHQGSTLLRGKLGAVHPWTLAAAVDHARVVAASGQSAERATGLAIKAHETCAEFLGAGHPYTIVAAHNHRLAVGHGGSDNEAWKEIDVDVPES